MAKLNQIIAIEKGIKSQSYAKVSEFHKVNQKPELFNGFSKEYQPVDADGEALPAESKRVQFTVPEVLQATERYMTELLNITARKDYTNTTAKADIVLDDVVLIRAAPPPYLLFLEKQLNDLKDFADKLPVLDANENWNKDENSGLFKATATMTHRTKKVHKAIVMYPATPEHPAQTQMVIEDILAGHWKQMKLSGAMPKPEKEKLLERIDKLSRAVKQAREQANLADEVKLPNIGEILFGYLMPK